MQLDEHADVQEKSVQIQMTHQSRSSISVTVLLTLAAWLLLSDPCLALDCPTPTAPSGSGVIQETPAEIDHLAGILASGDTGPQVQLIVSALRNRYPGVGGGEIVNYLMTAYCPDRQSYAGRERE